MNCGVVGFEITTLDSLQFDFATIEVATNKFSQDRRIGKGGYGEVFKVIYMNVNVISNKLIMHPSLIVILYFSLMSSSFREFFPMDKK